MAKPTITDEELNLKRHARRRLIGAMVLVLAVVVILPMIFDGEPSPGTPNEIELRIPQRETLPPLAPQPASEPVASVAVSEPGEQPQSAPAAVPVAASAVTPPAMPEVNSKAERPAPVVASKPADKQAAKPAAKTGWVVQVGAYSNHDKAKNMAARLSKEGFRVYTEQVGNMVRVRVGSYPTREAADKIRLKLEKLGLHPNLVNLEQP
jgi:DedD protein